MSVLLEMVQSVTMRKQQGEMSFESVRWFASPLPGQMEGCSRWLTLPQDSAP